MISLEKKLIFDPGEIDINGTLPRNEAYNFANYKSWYIQTQILSKKYEFCSFAYKKKR